MCTIGAGCEASDNQLKNKLHAFHKRDNKYNTLVNFTKLVYSTTLNQFRNLFMVGDIELMHLMNIEEVMNFGSEVVTHLRNYINHDEIDTITNTMVKSYEDTGALQKSERHHMTPYQTLVKTNKPVLIWNM